MNKLKIGPHTLDVSNRDKVLFPEDGITKGELIDYYHDIAEVMLPHLRGRPLMMQRFPDGIAEEGFFQKDVPDYFPRWVKRVRVAKEGGELTQLTCDNVATLVYLANQACITPHIWLSRADRVDYPDQMVFDLDPPAAGADFGALCSAAQSLRSLLEELDLTAFLKTTGARGLHVVVPLEPVTDFDAVRSFAHDAAALLVARDPEHLTVEQRKQGRRGRVYIDTLRNAYAQTAVAPYAVRARAGAPVATPLEWGELEARGLHAEAYTLRNIRRRLDRLGDPWHDMRRHAAPLSQAVGRLEELAARSSIR